LHRIVRLSFQIFNQAKGTLVARLTRELVDSFQQLLIAVFQILQIGLCVLSQIWPTTADQLAAQDPKIINKPGELFHLGVGKAGLYPGDVILTGTPAGIGAGRGEFLKPGDVVKLWIKKIGSLTNTMI
jgi:hypothetical protein